METLTFIGSNKQAHIALFGDVKNASSLKMRLIAASRLEGPAGDIERAAVNFAFVDASMITSKLHLQTAMYHAILAESNNALRTKYVHSEILFMLNPNNNISDAIRRFGISDSSKALLVIRISEDNSQNATTVEEAMLAAVQGNLIDIGRLSEVTNWAAVRKCYKLNSDPALLRPSAHQDLSVSIDSIVISTVAIKSVAG